MVTKYLLYVDILGFEQLAEDIAKESGFPADYVRQNLLWNPFNDTVQNKREKYYYLYQGTDNFIIILDDVDSLFSTLERILNIKIEQVKFGLIPDYNGGGNNG